MEWNRFEWNMLESNIIQWIGAEYNKVVYNIIKLKKANIIQ